MLYILSSIGLILIASSCSDSYNCQKNNYELIKAIPDITYATYSNKYLGGFLKADKELKLDLYVSSNGIYNPLIVVFFGGAFVTGNKKDVNPVKFCEEMVKRGFSCASVDYKTLDESDMSRLNFNVIELGYSATLSGKAALRHLSTRYQDFYNGYEMVVAGFSSGAILANNVAFLSPNEPIEDQSLLLNKEYGDLNSFGNSDKMESDIIGVVSLGGAVFSRDVIDKEDNVQFVFNCIGEEDNVISNECALPFPKYIVKYNDILDRAKSALRSTIFEKWLQEQKVVTVCGGEEMHYRAQKEGIDSHLLTFEQTGHSMFTSYNTDNLQTSGIVLLDSLARYICERH